MQVARRLLIRRWSSRWSRTPQRLTLALDDTPTTAVRAARPGGRRPPQPDARPGRLARIVYGHVFVVLALLATHPAWGVDRPALAGPALRPEEGPARHRPEAPAGVPDQAGTGRRVAPVGQAVAGAAGQAALGGRRRGLCQGELPQAGEGPGDDRRQPTPQGRGVADVARPTADGPSGAGRGSTATGGSTWPSEPASGGAGRPDAFDLYGETGGQAVQDVPGDLATGRRGDPGGAGGRADRLAGVLLHRHLGERGRRSWATVADRFSLEIDLSRLQAGRRGRPAAGAVHLGERRGVPPLPVDLHDDRGVGLGP